MSTDSKTADLLDADVASDRAGTICMIAIFEDILGDAIRNRLVTLSNTQDARLFGDRGPLGTFSAKIDFGHALGLYRPETRSVLHCIRKIRNGFAHWHDADSFTNPKIQKLCNTLPGYEPGRPGETRTKFNHAVLLVASKMKSTPHAYDDERPKPTGEMP